MNLNHLTIRQTIKSNLVIVFILLLLLFIDLFVLFLLNETARKKKSEIIRTTQIDQIDQAAGWVNEIHRQMSLEVSDETYRSLADDFFRKDNMFYRIEFYPFVNLQKKIPAFDPTFDHEIPNKPGRLNNFWNCLFTRTYSEFRVFRYHRKPLGLFKIYNATPKNVPEIESLVLKYRLWGGLFILITAIVVAVLLRQIILPLRRVSRSLETMGEKYIPLLLDPNAKIELAYNQMAKNARITQIRVRLNELITDINKEALSGEDPLEKAAGQLPCILCDFMNFSRVAVFSRDESSAQLDWGYGYEDGTGEWYLSETFTVSGISPQESEIRFADRAGIQSQGNDFEDKVTAQKKSALVPIFSNNRPLCHLLLWPIDEAVSSQELLESAEIIRSEVEEMFLKIIISRSILEKEKTEVSLHLSTNLGHDLTNIIATSKWDLDTLQKAMELEIVQVQGEPIQKQRYNEAVRGLLNNTRMLQEIVDIYRAFANTERPIYEETEVHQLIRQLTQIFTLGMSKNVKIRFDFKADQSCWVMEPRLIKLALFNLLSNSVQAIANMQERGVPTSSEILIRTEITREGWLAIIILDSGPGFLTPQGTPMNSYDLRKMFRYGFTTKQGEARGGLGLSWVWTIITEFHEGQIIPATRPEGGAKMTVLLPPLREKIIPSP